MAFERRGNGVLFSVCNKVQGKIPPEGRFVKYSLQNFNGLADGLMVKTGSKGHSFPRQSLAA